MLALTGALCIGIKYQYHAIQAIYDHVTQAIKAIQAIQCNSSNSMQLTHQNIILGRHIAQLISQVSHEYCDTAAQWAE